jgi:hypothetical protein
MWTKNFLMALFLISHLSGYLDVAYNLQGETQPVVIEFPLPGQALLGNVSIVGNTSIDDFQSSELSFGYQNNPTNTWFLIERSDQPVSNDVIASWDTTTITDGNYILRLVILLEDGQQQTITVSGIRVRNYSPIETDTPTPTTPTVTPLPGDTPIPTTTPSPTITPIPPTLTPLPTNPAQLSPSTITNTAIKGVIGVFVLFGILGIYIYFKRSR